MAEHRKWRDSDFGPPPGPNRYPGNKPRHAASLVIADLRSSTPRFLMGRRHLNQEFLPGYLVFPGGGLERRDHFSRDTSLPTEDFDRLFPQSPASDPGGALLACAIRETLEETGIDLRNEKLRYTYLARAITPPGYKRRYDTRFFLTTISGESSLPAHDVIRADDELNQIGWYDSASLDDHPIHHVTHMVLDTAFERLKHAEPTAPAEKVPVHRYRFGKPIRDYE